MFVTFSPTACEDGERHDLSGGVLRVVVGMVQSMRSAKRTPRRGWDRATCNEPVSARPCPPKQEAGHSGESS